MSLAGRVAAAAVPHPGCREPAPLARVNHAGHLTMPPRDHTNSTPQRVLRSAWSFSATEET